MNNVVLVTGSQGFIGSYICADLLSNDYKVIGIDNFSKYGKVGRPHDSNNNFSFYEIDVQNISSIDEDPDYIISCAAMVGGISYFHKYAYDLLAANERIMAATFDYAIDEFKNGSLKRILVLSSSMVFESTDIFPTPENAIYKCSPPSSTYGFQKLACEYFCKGAYQQYGLPYTIVRPFNCVGVGEDDKIEHAGDERMMMGHVLPNLVWKALRYGPDRPLAILGSGNQIRHYTSGKDIARGIRLAMESGLAENEDFNISSDRATSVEELAHIIWNQVHPGELLELKYLVPFEHDVQIRSPDVVKARNVLGFVCEESLENVVSEVIEWHISKIHRACPVDERIN